ncbi:MAG: DUF6497 family protein [Roseinatronobacter sp.]
MRVLSLILAAGCATLAPVAAAGMLILPSGESARPLPVIWDEDTSAIRLRFVVERLSEPASLYAGDPLRVFEDMQWLCETQVPVLFDETEDPRADGWEGAVVTLMDREVVFGTVDTNAVQLFEWFIFGIDGCEIDLDAYDE